MNKHDALSKAEGVGMFMVTELIRGSRAEAPSGQQQTKVSS